MPRTEWLNSFRKIGTVIIKLSSYLYLHILPYESTTNIKLFKNMLDVSTLVLATNYPTIKLFSVITMVIIPSNG